MNDKITERKKEIKMMIRDIIEMCDRDRNGGMNHGSAWHLNWYKNIAKMAEEYIAFDNIDMTDFLLRKENEYKQKWKL